MSKKLERDFQKELKKKLKKRFPGIIVTKNDEQDISGFPDLTLLYKDKYAVLELKRESTSVYQANQKHYLKKIREMGAYSASIHPENEEEILDELQQAFGA